MRFWGTRKTFGALAIGIGCVIFAAAQPKTPPQIEDTKPVKIFTEEIKLNVSVFDDYGKFVSGIEKEDLVVVEDGRLHKPKSIRRIPASVLIVLDTGGEMRNVKGLRQTRATASKIIEALSKEDSIAILEYHDKARILSEWTSDKPKLAAALKGLNFGKRSLFVEGLEMATKYLSRTELENRHLILITDGTDSLDRKERRKAEMERLMTTNINVHVISYSGLEAAKITPKTKRTGAAPIKTLPDEVVAGLPNGVRDTARATNILTINTDRKFLRAMRKRKNDLEEGGEFLFELSKNTNGMFLLPESKEEMLEKSALIARIIDSNYVVTYEPRRSLADSKDGEIRTIEVSSRRSGIRVAGYRKLLIRHQKSLR